MKLTGQENKLGFKRLLTAKLAVVRFGALEYRALRLKGAKTFLKWLKDEEMRTTLGESVRLYFRLFIIDNEHRILKC